MLKFIVTIALLIGLFQARSQTCVVKSFRWVDPREVKGVPKTDTDLTGKKCAIIKVETKDKGLAFDFGLTGNAVATVHHPSQQWQQLLLLNQI